MISSTSTDFGPSRSLRDSAREECVFCAVDRFDVSAMCTDTRNFKWHRRSPFVVCAPAPARSLRASCLYDMYIDLTTNFKPTRGVLRKVCVVNATQSTRLSALQASRSKYVGELAQYLYGHSIARVVGLRCCQSSHARTQHGCMLVELYVYRGVCWSMTSRDGEGVRALHAARCAAGAAWECTRIVLLGGRWVVQLTSVLISIVNRTKTGTSSSWVGRRKWGYQLDTRGAHSTAHARKEMYR